MGRLLKTTGFKLVRKGGFYWPLIIDLDRIHAGAEKISRKVKHLTIAKTAATIIWKTQMIAGIIFPSKAKYQTWVCEK